LIGLGAPCLHLSVSPATEIDDCPKYPAGCDGLLY
jgi:hypothetical protein